MPCQRFCKGAACGSDAVFDEKECCEIKDTCVNLQCPSDKVKLPDIDGTACYTTECTVENDVGTCCTDRALCSTLHDDGTGCGEGWNAINAAGMCLGATYD